MSQLDLIAHLCSRLCHDLVGPVSAVANGVELMEDEDDPAMQKQAIELLAHSADLASRRLKFYRLAFGAAGGEGVPIQLTEARNTCRDFLSGTRINLSWPDESVIGGDRLPKAAVKLLLNLVLIVAESLPRGGNLNVTIAANGGGLGIRVEASGAETRLNDTAEQALLAALLAQGLESKLELQRGPEFLALSVSVANVA